MLVVDVAATLLQRTGSADGGALRLLGGANALSHVVFAELPDAIGDARAGRLAVASWRWDMDETKTTSRRALGRLMQRCHQRGIELLAIDLVSVESASADPRDAAPGSFARSFHAFTRLFEEAPVVAAFRAPVASTSCSCAEDPNDDLLRPWVQHELAAAASRVQVRDVITVDALYHPLCLVRLLNALHAGGFQVTSWASVEDSGVATFLAAGRVLEFLVEGVLGTMVYASASVLLIVCLGLVNGLRFLVPLVVVPSLRRCLGGESSAEWYAARLPLLPFVFLYPPMVLLAACFSPLQDFIGVVLSVALWPTGLPGVLANRLSVARIPVRPAPLRERCAFHPSPSLFFGDMAFIAVQRASADAEHRLLAFPELAPRLNKFLWLSRAARRNVTTNMLGIGFHKCVDCRRRCLVILLVAETCVPDASAYDFGDYDLGDDTGGEAKGEGDSDGDRDLDEHNEMDHKEVKVDHSEVETAHSEVDMAHSEVDHRIEVAEEELELPSNLSMDATPPRRVADSLRKLRLDMLKEMVVADDRAKTLAPQEGDVGVLDGEPGEWHFANMVFAKRPDSRAGIFDSAGHVLRLECAKEGPPRMHKEYLAALVDAAEQMRACKCKDFMPYVSSTAGMSPAF